MNKDGDENIDQSQLRPIISSQASPSMGMEVDGPTQNRVTFSLAAATTTTTATTTAEESASLGVKASSSEKTSTRPASSLSSDEADQVTKLKRKRKSPEKPWKKPPDMPKRPLSAYNLFFKDERERILGQMESSGAGQKGIAEELLMMEQLLSSSDPMDESDIGDNKDPAVVDPAMDDSVKSSSKRGSSIKKSGVGFAGLAMKISTKWKSLSDKEKEPYEKIASGDKKRYEEEVALWRKAQKEKKESEAKLTVATSAATAERRSSIEPPSSSVQHLDPLLGPVAYGSSRRSYQEDDTTGQQQIARGEQMTRPLHLTSSQGQHYEIFNQHAIAENQISDDSYPSDWFETSDRSSSGRNPIFQSSPMSAMQGRAARQSFQQTSVDHRSVEAIHMQQRQQQLEQQQHQFALSLSSSYPATGISHDMESSAASENPELDRYEDHVRRQRALDLSRQNVLEQYNEYLERQEEIRQRQLQMRQQEIQLQQEIKRHQQREIQLRQEESRILPQHSTRVIIHQAPQETRQHQQVGQVARLRGSPGYTSTRFPPTPVLDSAHTPLMRSRPSTPHELSSRNDMDYSPLTPIFGLPLEDQLTIMRDDRSFFLDSSGAADPIAPQLESVPTWRSEERRRRVESLAATIRERPQVNSLALGPRPRTVLLQPRRIPRLPTASQMSLEAEGGEPLDNQVVTDTRHISLDRSLPAGTRVRLAHVPQRSASLSRLQTARRYQQAHRDDEQRRYSVAGTFTHRQLEETQELQIPHAAARTQAEPEMPRRYIRQTAYAAARMSQDSGDVSTSWPMMTPDEADHLATTPTTTNTGIGVPLQLQQAQQILQRQQQSRLEHMTPESMINAVQSLSEKLDEESIEFLTKMNK